MLGSNFWRGTFVEKEMRLGNFPDDVGRLLVVVFGGLVAIERFGKLRMTKNKQKQGSLS